MELENLLTDAEIALIDKFDKGNCSPLEFFNIKMYFGLRNDPKVLQHIMDEEKWQSELIQNKYKLNEIG
jgi:hypothetical protein